MNRQNFTAIVTVYKVNRTNIWINKIVPFFICIFVYRQIGTDMTAIANKKCTVHKLRSFIEKMCGELKLLDKYHVVKTVYHHTCIHIHKYIHIHQDTIVLHTECLLIDILYSCTVLYEY